MTIIAKGVAAKDGSPQSSQHVIVQSGTTASNPGAAEHGRSYVSVMGTPSRITSRMSDPGTVYVVTIGDASSHLTKRPSFVETCLPGGQVIKSIDNLLFERAVMAAKGFAKK